MVELVQAGLSCFAVYIKKGCSSRDLLSSCMILGHKLPTIECWWHPQKIPRKESESVIISAQIML